MMGEPDILGHLTGNLSQLGVLPDYESVLLFTLMQFSAPGLRVYCLKDHRWVKGPLPTE